MMITTRYADTTDSYMHKNIYINMLNYPEGSNGVKHTDSNLAKDSTDTGSTSYVVAVCYLQDSEQLPIVDNFVAQQRNR